MISIRCGVLIGVGVKLVGLAADSWLMFVAFIVALASADPGRE